MPLKLLEEGNSPAGTRFGLFTDGRSNILVDETNYPDSYGGLIYFNDKLPEIIPKLKKLGLEVEEMKNGDQLFSAMFLTPDGVTINIVNASHKGSPNPRGDSVIDWGGFGEYAVKVESLDESIPFWEKIGFKNTYRNDEWKFAIVSDGILLLELHAHEMDNRPAITYFDPDMVEKVTLLKKRGIEMRSEKKYDVGGKEAIDASAVSPDGQIWYFFTGNV